MSRKMFLLVCMNEDIRLAGTPTLHADHAAAETAMRQEVDDTVEMFRSEGWDDDNISCDRNGNCPFVRCGESEYNWEITEIEIPD